MLSTPSKAKDARGFLFERNGKRMIACWHTSGSSKFAITLDRAESVELSGMRYFETSLSREAAKAAWTAATAE